jgi:carboxyl-terminal processing protease
MSNNNQKKSVYFPVLLALAVVLGMFLNSLFQGGTKVDKGLFVVNQPNKLETVLDMIDEDYVDTVSKNRLVEEAIPAILKDLDPHTVYIPAKDLQKVNDDLQGNFGGIGVQFIKFQDTVAVVRVIPGGPSERAGIIAGDRIVSVDDSLIAGVKMKDTDIMKRLKGPSGSPVKVSIARKGVKDLMHFNIVRGQIPMPSVDVAYMLDDRVGYIKVNRFAATTFYEFSKGLDKLKQQGLQKLIIDLRGNQGGFLSEATQMINEFLPERKMIVYTQGKSQPKTDYMSNGKGACKELPISILIDEGSASASEIFAGAIQDNDRGQIIGRRSFGKGLVQEQRLLPDGSALRLTVARYYTPTGRCIQKSYSNGKDDYYNDLNTRYMHGEFSQADSIHFNDSLKFVTPGGKIVYGGGGIMPDIFVPADTSGYSKYLEKLRRKSLIYQFAFTYVDNHRKELANLKDHKAIVKYLNEVNILGQLISYAQKEGIKRDDKGLRDSRKIIKTQLMAYIARDLIDDDGYFPIIRDLDSTLEKAYTLMQ